MLRFLFRRQLSAGLEVLKHLQGHEVVLTCKEPLHGQSLLTHLVSPHRLFFYYCHCSSALI